MEDGTIRKSGYMKKLGEFHKSWKKRYFELTNDKLVYYKTEDSRKSLGNINLLDTAPCIPSRDSDNPDTILYLVAGTRLYQLKAESEEDRDAWIATISKHSRACKENLLFEKADSQIKNAEYVSSNENIFMQKLRKQQRDSRNFERIEMSTIRPSKNEKKSRFMMEESKKDAEDV